MKRESQCRKPPGARTVSMSKSGYSSPKTNRDAHSLRANGAGAGRGADDSGCTRFQMARKALAEDSEVSIRQSPRSNLVCLTEYEPQEAQKMRSPALHKR